MTQEQYDKSIATGELQLGFWDKLSYFFIVIFLFFIPAMFIVFDLFDKSTNFVSPPIWFIIIPSVLGFLTYLLQKSRLKFQIVKSNLGKNELIKLIKQVGTEIEWDIIFEKNNILKATTKSEFFSNDTGQQITILFNYDTVMINCIYYLGRKSSLDITGKNKRTVDKFIDKINSAEKDKTQ